MQFIAAKCPNCAAPLNFEKNACLYCGVGVILDAHDYKNRTPKALHLPEERDELFEDALRICVEMRRASTSVIQRRLRIGYSRAAGLLDMMEREGFIGQADGARPRPILNRAYQTLR